MDRPVDSKFILYFQDEPAQKMVVVHISIPTDITQNEKASFAITKNCTVLLGLASNGWL